ARRLRGSSNRGVGGDRPTVRRVTRLVIAALLVAVAVVVAVVAERRQKRDAPTQPTWRVPAQLDRADFGGADTPWLVAVFTSPRSATPAPPPSHTSASSRPDRPPRFRVAWATAPVAHATRNRWVQSVVTGTRMASSIRRFTSAPSIVSCSSSARATASRPRR